MSSYDQLSNLYIYSSLCYQTFTTAIQPQKKNQRKKMGKSKVLVVGATGYIGRRIVKASLAQGHTTYVLQRPEIGLDIEKIQMLLSFKQEGAILVEGSFSDHKSLVDAVKKVDVVICTMSGVHFRSHNILLQLKLVEAIKEAGNVKVGFVFVGVIYGYVFLTE